MPLRPASQAVRRDVSDILSTFLSGDRADYGPIEALRSKVYEQYSPQPVDVRTLSGLLGGDSDLRLKDQNRFLFLEPIVSKKILPFVTLQTSDRWVHFRAYVLLTLLDECDTLQALVVRFETDEGTPDANGTIGSHDFCHAQLCRSINSRTTATTPKWLPESQPSFPLDADDQVGLVLCMLTSLYGGRYVVERLNMATDGNLSRHRVKIRSLAPFDA